MYHEDSFVRRSAADALVKIADSDIITQMWQLLLFGVEETKDIILKIQELCKFYNHEIFHFPPVVEEQNIDSSSPNQPINIHTPKLIMQEPINNFKFGDNSNIGFSTGNNSPVEVTGNQFKTQNNYAPEQKQSLSEAAKEIQELLAQLQTNYPTTTESEQQVFVNQFNEQVKTNSRVRDIILAGGIELIKMLCPLFSIPIEMSKKWLETAEKHK
ncbi:MAG: hypothetical protein QNJ47_02060 [Nostocaceae cyanobacterium]|nr:hypothetical protein [Nostocaceae cyanobacterium]